jgi:hypothetical protein
MCKRNHIKGLLQLFLSPDKRNFRRVKLPILTPESWIVDKIVKESGRLKVNILAEQQVWFCRSLFSEGKAGGSCRSHF